MVELSVWWQPNDREVSSKVIDGEAIIIRLSDGIYYSMDKAGALIWSLIEEQRSNDQIIAAVAARYDVTPDDASRDVRRILQELVDERLVVPASLPATDPAASPAGAREPYVAPALNIYRDMGDLLALDPPAPGLMDIAWIDPSKKS